MTIDMPVLASPCQPEGGVQVRVSWTSDDPENRTGYGSDSICGVAETKLIWKRLDEDWIPLRPGEFLTVTENFQRRYRNFKPGVVEYWVECSPPDVTPEMVNDLLKSGHFIPDEKLETPHSRFRLNWSR